MSNYKERLSEKEQIEYKLYLDSLNYIVGNNLEDAKISIKNGFYTLFAEDAKKAGYDIINVFKSELNGFYDVFLKKHPKETSNWEQVRIQAAIEMMKSMRSSKSYDTCSREEIARFSVKYADALVKELKGKQP